MDMPVGGYEQDDGAADFVCPECNLRFRNSSAFEKHKRKFCQGQSNKGLQRAKVSRGAEENKNHHNPGLNFDTTNSRNSVRNLPDLSSFKPRNLPDLSSFKPTVQEKDERVR